MTIVHKSKIAKAAAAAAGLGLVLGSFAPVASAASASELQAQLAALIAQVTALQAQLGTSAAASPSTSMMFSKDLMMGSTGPDVAVLQKWLMKKGFTLSAGATGYFGMQTKAALTAYQAANKLNSSGSFDGATRTKVNGDAAPASTMNTSMPTTTGTMMTGDSHTTGTMMPAMNTAPMTSSMKSDSLIDALMSSIDNDQSGLSNDLSQSASASNQSDSGE
jgi:peptidoglycan hydrolase-like protein with peptidoglycan-binding domain